MKYIMLIMIVACILSSAFWYMQVQETKRVLRDFMTTSEIIYDHCDEVENECADIIAKDSDEKQQMKEILIHSENCDQGLAALQEYHANYDEKTGWVGHPVHNWASHGADAFRTFGIGWSEYAEKRHSNRIRTHVHCNGRNSVLNHLDDMTHKAYQ